MKSDANENGSESVLNGPSPNSGAFKSRKTSLRYALPPSPLRVVSSIVTATAAYRFKAACGSEVKTFQTAWSAGTGLCCVSKGKRAHNHVPSFVRKTSKIAATVAVAADLTGEACRHGYNNCCRRRRCRRYYHRRIRETVTQQTTMLPPGKASCEKTEADEFYRTLNGFPNGSEKNRNFNSRTLGKCRYELRVAFFFFEREKLSVLGQRRRVQVPRRSSSPQSPPFMRHSIFDKTINTKITKKKNRL